jgi:hypothetical protein
MNQAGAGGVGYVLSTTAVDTPSDSGTTFAVHTFDPIAGVDLTNAHFSQYPTWLAAGGTSTGSSTVASSPILSSSTSMSSGSSMITTFSASAPAGYQSKCVYSHL